MITVLLQKGEKMRLIDADEVYKVLTDYYHQRTEIQHKALKEAIERVPTVEAEPIRHGHWLLDKHGNWVCEFCGNAPYHSDMYNMNYCPNCGARLTIESDNITTHLIWNEPTVQPEPIRHGRWIFKPKDAIEMMFTLPKCSQCGAESSDAGNYCPNCGAKMDGGDEEENT